MPSPLELAIRSRLAGYLAGEASLDQFKDWLVGATWDVEQTGDAAAIDLTYEIKLLLAEQSSERWPESHLRQQLASLAGTPSVSAMP